MQGKIYILIQAGKPLLAYRSKSEARLALREHEILYKAVSHSIEEVFWEDDPRKILQEVVNNMLEILESADATPEERNAAIDTIRMALG